MRKKIKLFDPTITYAEEKAVKGVLKSKFWASGAGVGLVKKFEIKLNKYVNSSQCIALNSGTAALHLALSMYNLKNKEVIIPSLSFVSTAHAVVYNGGTPVFVDVDPKTLCISPNKIEEKINKKTFGIIPVHFGGMSCDLHNISKIAKKYDLHIVEDAAHAIGSSYEQKKIGSHSELVCFSFHPVKNLAMPTGGAICINDKNYKKIAEKLKSKRWCGITNREDTQYDVKEIGWNYYMNEFSAAIGIEQIKKLDKMNAKRKKIANRYSKELDTNKKMQFNKECVYHLFWVLVKNRDQFRKNMLKNRIETGTHYFPIHKMSYYNSKSKLKTTEEIGKMIVTLPIHANMTEGEIDDVIKYANRFMDK